MGVKTIARAVLTEKLVIPFMIRFLRFEKDVLKWPQAIRSVPDSPTRFNIPMEALKRFQRGEGGINRAFSPKTMMSIMQNMRKSVRSLGKNAQEPQKMAPPEFFKDLVDYAKTLGVSHVGYAKLPSKYVFQDLAVLYKNAIVLAMEMDKERMDKAPSYDTMIMVMETYDELGIASNKIAEFLSKHGFGAHAGHPLGGMALYPPLGQMAGFGFHGRQGLIITPEFGPRIRLTAVFTSIENLPYQESNEHEWARKFCDSCKLCLKKCPTKAILETPIPRKSRMVTYVDHTKCFPYFAEFYGCSVCIKVCPFSTGAYSQIKQRFVS
jgi:epoxyqueuosine reductase